MAGRTQGETNSMISMLLSLGSKGRTRTSLKTLVRLDFGSRSREDGVMETNQSKDVNDLSQLASFMTNRTF